MRKKFYETPSVDFKMFESQEDLLSYTVTTDSYPDEWGEGVEDEDFE